MTTRPTDARSTSTRRFNRSGLLLTTAGGAAVFALAVAVMPAEAQLGRARDLARKTTEDAEKTSRETERTIRTARDTAATEWIADPIHSSVIFKVRHQDAANIYGRFNKLTGRFTIDEAQPSNSAVSFEIDVRSVDTNHNGRDDHLRNADFFNTKQHRTATFESTSLTAAGGNTWTLRGDLTLAGTTKPIEATLVKTGEAAGRDGQVSGWEATFTIQRSEFGLTQYLAADRGDSGPIGNTVEITVAVEAKAS